MKKLALLLILALTLGVCLAPAMAEDSKQMVVAWWGNQTRNERTQAALDLYSEENPGVTFDPQFVAWDDYWTKLATASAGHTLPDVLQMDYQYLSQYVGNDLLVDLAPYAEEGTLDLSRFNEGIVRSGMIGEGIYAICLGVNAPAMLYNKTLLDENGIEVKDGMTMDEFIALSKEIYEKTGYKTNMGYGGEMVLDYILRAEGKSLFDGTQLAISEEDAAKFFSFYQQGVEEGWHLGSEVFAETSIGSIEQSTLVYGADPSTMSWNSYFWSNQMLAVQNAAPEGMEIGVTTWPSDDVAKSNYLKPSQFFSVSVDSKNPEEAVKVIDFFSNSIACNDILLGERGIPASSEVADAIAPKLDDVNQKVVAYINEVASPNSAELPATDPQGANEIYALVLELLEQVCYGALDAQAAGAELVAQGTEIMAST